MTMRVAIVTETFQPSVNGIVRMLLEYLAYLRAQGHEAIVFAPGDGERVAHGFDVIRVTGAPFPLYPELILAPFSTRMGRLLKDWRPDVVHLAGPFVLGAHGLNVARSLGVPVAAHYQTAIDQYAEHFGLRALGNLAWRRLIDIHNNCDITFAPCMSVARDLRARGMRRVHISGRGVDTCLFHPRRDDAELRHSLAPNGRPILLYVGRLSPEKNLAALIKVARAVPDCPLVIVGDGPARGLLAAQLAGWNVRLTGALHGLQLATAYASADIFIFPSATETFGQVVREAMASGLPSVAIRAGGVQDVVRDGSTGILCPPGDDDAFVQATKILVGDPDLRRSAGRAARREAEKHTWPSVFDRLMTWYAGLVSPQEAQLIAGG
jgi:phosphatidylinositol alpha 1,6-mannosyltransferase